MTETHDPGEGVEGQGQGQVEDEPDRIESVAVDVEAEVSMIRDLVFKAHPDVVRELLIGETLTDILASVEPARRAYQRIADQVERERRPGTPLVAEVDSIPVPDQAALTTTQRLRLGLRERADTQS